MSLPGTLEFYLEKGFLTSIHLVIKCLTKSQCSVLVKYTVFEAHLPRAGPGLAFGYVTLTSSKLADLFPHL